MTGRRLDWTAGRHWREAMTLGGEAADVTDSSVRGSWLANRALFHLAAAQLLLDHPPWDFDEMYPVDGPGPSRDWRDD